MKLIRLAFVMLLGLGALAVAPSAHAQEQVIATYLSAGSGLTIGADGGSSVLLRSPVFLDIGARTWASDQSELVYGGSLRLEVDGRVGVGVVPKVEYARTLGPIGISVGGGLPIFLAPYTLFGVEAFLTGRFMIGDVFGVFGSFLVDAYLFGSDLPRGTAIVMLNGVLGVELRF